MVNYQEAKIYCIKSYQTKKVYVGSTCQKLSQRMAEHRYDYNYYLEGKNNYISSFEILKYEDAFIELIKKFPCEDRDELRKLEGYYIEKLNCVNKRVAGRTHKEAKKAYRQTEKGKATEKLYAKKINEIKYACPCGGSYDVSHKARHKRTIRHRLYLLSLHNELNHLEL